MYREEKQDFEDIVRTESGRRWLYNFLLETGAESLIFSPEPQWNAYYAGRAEVGKGVLALLRSLPDGLLYEKLMREESISKQKEEMEESVWQNFK